MGAIFQFTVQLESTGPCPTCGVEFAMPSNLVRTLRLNKKSFYCPNGHSQSFTTSRLDELEAELKRERERRERAEDLAKRRDEANKQMYKTKQQTLGKLRRLKERVKNGVCPCCNRSFVQLQRHIATKHPEYAAQLEAAEGETQH